MVHDVPHAMSERKECNIYGRIHEYTETHGKVLKIISSLNSDVHEATNPVIEVSYMQVIHLFQIFSNKRSIHE